MLGFRIRSSGMDESGRFEKNDMYREHINGYRSKFASDLFRFFAGDFFHDGKIRAVEYSDAMRKLTFCISSPNISKNDSGRFASVKNVVFDCEFSDVVLFSSTASRIDDCNDPLSQMEQSVTFIASEINTMTSEIRSFGEMYGDEFNSLIIEMMPGLRVCSIVFSDLKVRSHEPIAFEMMIKSDAFMVPIFEG